VVELESMTNDHYGPSLFLGHGPSLFFE